MLSAALLWAGSAQAQLGISPMIVEVQANRGQAQGTINISNTSNAELRARVYVEPFTYSRDRGFEVIPSNPSDLSPYLQFSPRELTIPPGVTRRVRFIARFVPSLGNGEYRAVVFAEPLTETTGSNGSGNNVGIITRIGATVYVRNGELSPQPVAESASYNVERNQLQLLVRNAGQASVQLTGSWTLKKEGSTVRTGNLEQISLVAQSERNLGLSNSSPEQALLQPGSYELAGNLTWGGSDSKKAVPFNVTLTIPARSSASSNR
ncbi:P pilus assembly protein, chaperone PapD [Leptolyngbya sp. FACHB-261]|nr:P pilus assembly protein, chaperone PapD [Leptolyngbya sp. FACHB-261]